MKKRPWYLYVLSVGAVALAVMAIAQIGPPTSSARTSTQILTAENGVVQSTVSGTGNVAAGTDLNVNFQTSGTLSNVCVKAGQHVNKGQLLATLDGSAAQLTLDQAEQNLTAADAQLSTAQSSSAATTTTAPNSSGTASPAGGGSGGSGSGGGGSTGTTTSANPAATIASAQAAVYSAQASVNAAKTALANTKLYAPISGTIVSVSNLTPGDSVSAGSTGTASASSTTGSSSTSGTGGAGGTAAGSLGGSGSAATGSSAAASSSSPFAEIVNTNTMTMTVALSESDVSKVKVGQPATVTLDALTGVQLAAHVSSISTVATSSSGVVSYNATLTLDQGNSQVKPGMSAAASIIVAQAQGVNVPNSAITGTGSIATVTLDSNGKKTRKQVAVGLRGTTRTQIVSGLSAGDQLAVTTVLPPLTSGTSTTSTGSGTLGGTGVRPGGFGGGGFPGGGGGFGGGGPRGGAGGGGGGGGGGAGVTPAG